MVNENTIEGEDLSEAKQESVDASDCASQHELGVNSADDSWTSEAPHRTGPAEHTSKDDAAEAAAAEHEKLVQAQRLVAFFGIS